MNQFCRTPVPAPTTVACCCRYRTKHKTAVVLGIPQGGTSMVAAVVDALGVPVGREEGNFAHEGRPYCGDDEAIWMAKARKLNRELDAWAVKDALLWRFSATSIHNCLRNPYYLVVAKDMIGTAQRRCANHGVTEPCHIISVLRETDTQLRSMWNWVYELAGFPLPLLLVSYERALRKREEMCKEVACFLRLKPTAEEFKRAVARISTEGGYLQKDT